MSTTTQTHGKKRGGRGAAASPAAKRPHSPRYDGGEGEREAKRKHPCGGGDAEVLHGSFVVADLPSNMSAIYTRAVRRLLPQHQRQISDAGIMEEPDGATLTFEVPNKAVAAAMFKRLQNAKMYGRRWKVQYYPLSAVECAKQACLVDVRLVPAAPRALALRALGGVQGFLALIDASDSSSAVAPVATPATVSAGAAAGGQRPEKRHRTLTKGRGHASADVGDSDGEEDRDIWTGGGAPFAATAAMEGADVVEDVVASFVDEGSALHARAVLSGRLIGTSGVRLFLERHR
ncbi:uncharacterized protein Tco025E_02391 [Trypanosoma conorhini]|uniref:Uncharacterized protein n=1 Tax=Trypanosoma conorhini TaxID=83891 RepID=A0A3R7N3N3_9TRYP|nr:uncharacterized protein Tco025E_02391 [Trypanosoma conorhini]RNF24915.1 hypothetical protein Tco025E_02391 [Trypanosoma conorhini]